MKRAASPSRPAGFTLLEVMVAVLLVTIGIFGFAKMQALAIASTQAASSRSIIAIQANSLAAAMHGNRGFWSDGGLVPTSFSTSGAVVTDASGKLKIAVPANCEAATKPASPLCTKQQLAARDVQTWATNLASLLPTYTTAVVNCTNVTGTPVNCTLTISWTEKYVNTTRSAAADSYGTAGTRAYTLYIEP